MYVLERCLLWTSVCLVTICFANSGCLVFILSCFYSVLFFDGLCVSRTVSVSSVMYKFQSVSSRRLSRFCVSEDAEARLSGIPLTSLLRNCSKETLQAFFSFSTNDVGGERTGTSGLLWNVQILVHHLRMIILKLFKIFPR